MAKKRKSRRRPTRSGLSGFGGDSAREETFAEKAKSKAAQMHAALREAAPDCGLAFSRLLDTVSYSGMAEAAAVAVGGNTKKHASRAVEALTAFRRSCPVGGKA